ncbi:MAG: hypothetical protein H6568_11030 [Lewinellaceae bacterium]|nr:hypothetical protein [Lewinellaceae bacterium]HRW74826.1 hypothetical protein [Saprospiraceae bacterium]
MKNFALFFLIAILFPVIGIAQKKYEFQNDENYKAYQKDADKLLEKEIKFALLKKIMKDESVDEEEFKIIHNAFGFESRSGFEDYLAKQVSRVNVLEKRYQVSNMSMDDVAANDATESSLSECLENARLFAIKGHIACVPLDIQAIMGAFGAGAACHAAVEALRVLMIHICIQEHDINAAEEERKNAIEAIKTEERR